MPPGSLSPSPRNGPGRAKGVSLAQIEAGLAFARAWRAATKPQFDAIYGPEPDRCPTCGHARNGRTVTGADL